MKFRYFKTEEDLVKELTFIRQYFGEQAANSTSRFAFPNGITGAEVFERWRDQKIKQKRADLRYKSWMTKPLRDQLPATLYYGDQYETLFSLMEIFKTNKITEREIDFVLQNSKQYFNNYFDESLSTAEIAIELE